MKLFKGGRPSPSMAVALAALIVALAGTAMAAPSAIKSALSKSEKKQVKGIADGRVNALAPGLAVANAANANAVGGIAPTGLMQVGVNRGRVAIDNSEDSNYTNDVTLITLSNLKAGEWVISATTQLDSDDAAPQNVNCDLLRDTAELDSQSEFHGPDGAGASVLTHVLVGDTVASAAGTDDIIVRCTNPGGTFDADQEKIVATFLGATP